MYHSYRKRSFADSIIDNFVPLAIAAIVLLVIALIVGTVGIKAAGGLNIEFSEGQRSGTLYKLSERGLIWKTWEGELYLGTSRDGEGQIVNEKFYFSVSDPEVAKQLQETGNEDVTLTYKEYILRGYNKGATSYDVTGVK